MEKHNIHITFEPGAATAEIKEDVWQYDFGQVLQIGGLSLPPVVEVHYANKGEDIALPQTGVTEGGITTAPIPNEILEEKGAFTAYIFVTNGESGETCYTINGYVNKRPPVKGFDAPEDQEILHAAVGAVNAAAERAESAETKATEAAKQAAEDAKQTAADRAETERLVESVSGIGEQVTEVENLTKQAQTSATNAALSEQAAKTAETNAQTAQAGAETAEGNAELAERNVKASERVVEKAKQLVTQMGQEVLDNKNHVDQTVQAFDQAAQQAVADVNNAGQTQTERVQSAGNTATESVETEQGKATQAIETAKTEAVKAVQTEGTTQTGNVAAEGAKQVQAVQAAAQEIVADREQIAQNKADVTALKEDIANTKKITGEIVTPIITQNISLKSGEDAKLIDGVVGKTYLVLMDVDYVSGAAMVREYQYQWTGGMAYNQNNYFLITLKIGNIYIMPTGTNALNANVAVFDVTDNEKLKEYIVATGYEGIGTRFGGKLPEIDNTLSKEGQAADAKKVGDKFEKLEEKSNTFQYFKQNNPIKSAGSTYIDISTAIKKTANYTLRIYEVTPGAEVKIQGACLANPNTMLRYMFSSNIDGTEDITKGSATTGWTDSYEEKVTVPDSANYLLVNNQNSSIPYVYINTNIDVLDLLYGGWRNKKLVTYGDSITEGNTWQPYLMRRFGFGSIINKGIGGTTVAGSASNAFCSESRVQTVPSDADLVLIMGGTNDYGSIPIGTLESESDIENTTFKGALALTIKRIQEQCPDAVIMVCSPLSGRGTAGEDGTWPTYNSAGKTTYDYAVAAKEVAEFLSIPYIPVFERCGINQWNRTKYIADAVHPQDKGGEKIAMVMSEVLCAYQPFN